jgi:hypothetical protein
MPKGGDQSVQFKMNSASLQRTLKKNYENDRGDVTALHVPSRSFVCLLSAAAWQNLNAKERDPHHHRHGPQKEVVASDI